MKIDKIRVIILVVMISSLGLLARGYIHFSDIHQWPTTKGKVISYESGENTYVVHSMRSMQSTGSVEWNKVKYEYSIDGVTHTGNRISPNISEPRIHTKQKMSPCSITPRIIQNRI